LRAYQKYDGVTKSSNNNDMDKDLKGHHFSLGLSTAKHYETSNKSGFKHQPDYKAYMVPQSVKDE
jgi:hypothetical protein